ncbi:MAG: hypothetical protein AAFY83_13455 [Pseudomonadota bacterium]
MWRFIQHSSLAMPLVMQLPQPSQIISKSNAKKIKARPRCQLSVRPQNQAVVRVRVTAAQETQTLRLGSLLWPQPQPVKQLPKLLAKKQLTIALPPVAMSTTYKRDAPMEVRGAEVGELLDEI